VSGTPTRRRYLRAVAGTGLAGVAGCGSLGDGGDGSGPDLSATFDGGDGSRLDPYRVSTVEQLQAVADAPTANYRLVADVDASATAEWNDGAGFEPIGEFVPEREREETRAFTGTFDGGGHAIRGLTVDRPGESRGGVGLFGRARGATIEHLRLEGASVAGSVAGGLLGHGANRTTVRDVSVDAEVTGEAPVGGLVGTHNGDVIEAAVSGSVSGTRRVGGLAGEHGPGRLARSRSSAVVSGEEFVGGLCGKATTEVTDAAASGAVTGETWVGGLVGQSSASVQRCGATGDVEGGAATGGLLGLHCCADVHATFTRGDVAGGSVAGLVGDLRDGTLGESYATGRLSGDTTEPFAIEGADGSVGNCYHAATESDMEFIRSREDISGEEFLRFEEMRGGAARVAMAGFDFGGTWTTTTEYPALVEPASLAVSDLEPVEATVAEGEPITASVTVQNTGGKTEAVSVDLRVGVAIVARRRVTLEPGASTTVDFERSDADDGDDRVSQLDPGTYPLSVVTDADAAAGTLTVTGD
jgi:hypothetical protein